MRFFNLAEFNIKGEANEILPKSSFSRTVEALNLIIPTKRNKVFITWEMDLELLSATILLAVINLVSMFCVRNVSGTYE